MAYTIKSFDQILEDWVAWTVANASQITDMSPGSVIRSFCEGGSLAMEEIYVATYLGFRRYLDNIQETVFDFERKAGTKATANVIFSRPGTTGDVTIPIGTRVKTASGLRFILSATAYILNGNTESDPAEVEAEEVGTAYNVASATITIMEDTVTGVESVTNSNAATGGVDVESDLSFKNRFQAYIEGLGRSNVAGLSAGALSVEGITSVSVVENFPPVSNVNVDLYIDDGSTGGVSTAKVTETQEVIVGDGTESNPGYRAAGVNVLVQKPAVQTQNVAVTVTVISGVDTDQVDTDLNTVITEYINTLGVGNDIIYNEIVSAVMGVYGISDCDVTTQSANVSVASSQVGRVGTITITQV